MRIALSNTLRRIARWLEPKSMPGGLVGSQWSGTSFVDAYKRNRLPTANDVMAELKNTAFTCATINAATCASFPPKLYVTTHANQPAPKCLTKELDRRTQQRLRDHPSLSLRFGHHKALKIEQVIEHPLLTMLRQVNPAHNAFDLWELTTLYQEVHGSAYWYLSFGQFGAPESIWLLPSQNMTPKRDPNSGNLVDYYEYRSGPTAQRFSPDEIIHFRYPDPRDPYTSGLSPLRACWEEVALSSDYLAMKKAIYENTGVPSAVISPDEVLGEEERDRLEAQWNSKFRRGGAGKVLVAESGLKVQILSHSMGDLATLAEQGKTKEDIANAFHVPLSFLTSETNLANLQAAEHQHMSKAITPRLQRRDEKLNEQLIPLYDPTGRLFLASEDPVPLNAEQDLKQMQADWKLGVVTINEVRQERGLEPVSWGDTPWLPLNWAPSDYERREDLAPGSGRNREE